MMLCSSCMLNTQLITAAFPQSYDSAQFGFVSRIDIYLYRAPDLRPPDQLNPLDCWGDPALRPDRDFETTSECTPGQPSFVFHLQRASLQQNQPLWYQIVAYANFFHPNIFSTFIELGGGGTGPEDDAITLNDLHRSLRDFPQGWFVITKQDGQDQRSGYIKGDQIVQEFPEYVPDPRFSAADTTPKPGYGV